MSNDKQVATLEGQALTANPFGGSANVPAVSGGNALMTAETQRAIAEIQAMSIMAMHNPRNPQQSVDRILNECQRPSLAEVAIYSFPRGGQTVSGASIRLAEVIKRHWGHMRSGWRTLERGKGRSLIQAFAYDIQNNVGETRDFEVRHVRDKKGVTGGVPITDERDIYELEANQAARRVRACILALVDGDVVEAALDQCTRTLEAKADTTPDGIKRMLEAFKGFKVNQAMIEARLGRNLTAITAAQMVSLKNIMNGMKDGVSTPAHWFDVTLYVPDAAEAEKNSTSDANASLKDKIKTANPEAAAKAAEQKQEDQKPEPEEEGTFAILSKAMNNAKDQDTLNALWNDNTEKINGLLPPIKQTLDKIFKSAYDKLEKAQVTDKPDLLSSQTK